MAAKKKAAPKKAVKKGDEPVRAGKGKAQPSKSAIKLVKELADKQLGKNNYRLMTDKRGNTFATEKGASSADKARTKVAPNFQFRDITNRTSQPAKKR
jgi:hypothetical protein